MLNSIRKNVYDACAATGLSVYDYWVVNGELPYIIIEDITKDTTEQKDYDSIGLNIVIHVFVKSRGKLPAVQYVEEIENELRARLDKPVGLQLSSRFLSEQPLDVVHGVLNVRLNKFIKR